MTCQKTRPMLSAYLDRQLYAWERSAVADHAESCLDCQREISAILELKNILRAQPQPGLPAAVCATIKQKTVFASRPSPVALRWMIPSLALAGAAAGWLTLALAERVIERHDQIATLASAPDNFHPWGRRDKVAIAPLTPERTIHETMH
jgi:anti-sigma factor RsiW